MATAYITEYSNVGPNGMMALANSFVDDQTVAIGAGSVQSNAFNAATTVIQINVDSACSIAFGTNPTAAATNQRLGANETRYYGVLPGSNFKVAVIQNS